MPYSSVKELPARVRSKLKSPKKRRQWMHVWNSEYNRHGDEGRAFASAWSAVQKSLEAKISQEEASYQSVPFAGDECLYCSMFRLPNSCNLVTGNISTQGWCRYFDRKSKMSMADFNLFLPLAKVEKQKDGSVIVSGYASTPTLDLDDEIVSLDAIKKALPGYWEWRNIREMHQPSAVGIAKEANIDEKGLFLTARITDRDAAQKCLDEVYKGYSIGGRKLAKTGNTVTEIDLIEVSLVDRPANPDCRINISKRAKGSEAYLLKVAEPEVVKRDFSASERREAAGEGEALPDGSYPIKSKKDLVNAVGLYRSGHGKNLKAVRQHIIARASALGVENPLSSKDKKLAKKARKELRESDNSYTEKLISPSVAVIDALDIEKIISPSLAPRSELPAFLTLGRSEGDLSSGAEDQGFLELARPSPKLQKAGNKIVELEDVTSKLELGDLNVDQDTSKPDLEQALLDVLKRASQPSKSQRLGMCKANLKKANTARKEAREAIKSAHSMVKTSYISKAAKKNSKNDKDSDDFDHEGMMKHLSKAWSDLSSIKTFIKAAGEQVDKVSGRAGERGQEPSDGVAGVYEVPPGVRERSPSEMATMGPAGEGRGSLPPELGMIEPYPGKSAKSKFVPASEAELMVKNAKLEGELEAFKRIPASGGRRPYAFDVSKMNGQNPEHSKALFNGVNPSDLSSDNEQAHNLGVAKVIGNMITSGQADFGGGAGPLFGKSIFDPSFRGGAAGRQ